MNSGVKPRRAHLVLKRSKVNTGGSMMGSKRIPKRSELVFLQPSPNYCEPDLALGSLGTQGRYCNRTSKGRLERGISQYFHEMFDDFDTHCISSLYRNLYFIF